MMHLYCVTLFPAPARMIDKPEIAHGGFVRRPLSTVYEGCITEKAVEDFVRAGKGMPARV
jgi:hypothetical protein